MKLQQRLDHLESQSLTKEELDIKMSMSFLSKARQLEGLEHNEKLTATKARNLRRRNRSKSNILKHVTGIVL